MMMYVTRAKSPGLGASSTGFLITIFLMATSCWKFANGAIGETLQMSTILANTMSHLIEKLKSDENGDNLEAASGFPQTRGGGGYGHGGGGGGGHGHGAITLDPVSIISLLALGAFLINNILQLLRANQPAGTGTGRSMRNLDNMESFPQFAAALHATTLNDSTEPSFMNFFENVGSLYYLQPKKRNLCMKRVVCKYINMKESREKNSQELRTQIFDFMISTVTKLIAPDMSEADKDEKCTRAQKFCSDALLKDARVSVEYKIYSQVSSWLTKLAFNGLTSG